MRTYVSPYCCIHDRQFPHAWLELLFCSEKNPAVFMPASLDPFMHLFASPSHYTFSTAARVAALRNRTARNKQHASCMHTRIHIRTQLSLIFRGNFPSCYFLNSKLRRNCALHIRWRRQQQSKHRSLSGSSSLD
jgi:hypothetical protein